MTLDSLKKQAGRLATYLGANHRVNLKHASALEAIAAVHGARNWQTLAAGTGDSAGVPDGAVPRGGRAVERFTMTWVRGAPALTVPDSDWFRHTLATGTPVECVGWLEQHMVDCLTRSADGVFFNVLPEGYGPTFQAVRGGAPDTATAYSLLAGLSAQEATSMLMLAHPARRNDGSLAAHEQQLCELLLEAVIFAILERPPRLTLSLLLDCLEYSGMVVLLAKSKGVAEERLRSMLAMMGDMATSEPRQRVNQLVKPLVQALRALLAEPAARAVLDEAPDAPSPARSVAESIGAGGLWHVSLPAKGRTPYILGQLWMRALEFALHRRRVAGPAFGAPVVLGWTNAERFSGQPMVSIASQARSTPAALLLATRHEQDLGRAPSGAAVMLNIRQRLHLGVPGQVLEQEILRRLRASSAQLITQDEVRF
jgi:hypothetical protein